METPTKKRGRPAKIKEPELTAAPQVQEKIVEVIKEVIKTIEVEKPILENFALYHRAKLLGFPQGGIGQTMEDPKGTETAYVPHVSEVYGQFIGDPAQWESLRDAMLRAWIDNQ